MFEALRRLLWLFPSLALGAALLFFVLTKTIAPAHTSMPVFWNPDPKDAETEALAALEGLVADDLDAPRRLQRLGGVALPYVLPRLPSLSIQHQRKLSDALWPVAERMGLAHREGFSLQRTRTGVAPSLEVEDDDERLVFWQAYLEDHATDFRPLTVQRLVKRLSTQDLQLRRADLLSVDTYALPALVEHLGRASHHRDVERIRRLADLIAPLTDNTWRLSADATPEEARHLATEIRRYWDHEGGTWTTMDRFDRLAASVSQTTFSVWLVQSSRQITRLDSSDVGARLFAGMKKSGPLFACALLGALLLGPSLAVTLYLLGQKRKHDASFITRARLGLTLGLSALIPGLLLHPPRITFFQALLALAAGTLTSAFLLHRELVDRFDPSTQKQLAEQPRLVRLRRVARWLVASIPIFAPTAIAEATLWLTCLELGGEIPGLGRETFLALVRGDLHWLMMICVSLAALLGITQLLSDAWLGEARHRWRGI